MYYLDKCYNEIYFKDVAKSNRADMAWKSNYFDSFNILGYLMPENNTGFVLFQTDRILKVLIL